MVIIVKNTNQKLILLLFASLDCVAIGFQTFLKTTSTRKIRKIPPKPQNSFSLCL